MVAGPGRSGRRGGRPARLLSGIFRRGARRRFLCPSFRFPLARPPHSWSHREWGRGPGAGRPWLAPSGWGCVVDFGAPDWDPSPARPSFLPASAVGGSGSGVPGALLSAGLLCLGSFICQLREAGRGLHLPYRVSPPALESGCRSCLSPPIALHRSPRSQGQSKLRVEKCLANSFSEFGKDVPWGPV